VDFPASGMGDSIVAGDVDGDGKVDLVVGWAVGSAVAVYRNLASPGSLDTNSFAAEVDFPAPGWVRGVAMGDLNGDGKLDISLVGEVDSFMSVYQNVSTPGSFTNTSLASRVDYGAGWNPHGVMIGDLDGDGRPDIIFGNQYDNTISIYRNVMPFGGSPPSITIQPSNQTVAVGGTATFSVTATGSLPLSYQWNFNGTNILGETNTALTLTNVQFSQAGDYAVLVTNDYGSVLSSNAVLTVISPTSCAPAPAGLIGWWPGEGNANDSVGTNNGVLEGGASFATGEVGQAFALDGTSGFVFVPASSSLNVGLSSGLTIEGWINPRTIASQQPIVEWNSGSTCGAHFWMSVANVGNLYANVVDSGNGSHSFSSSPGIIVTNQFQHVALTYDKSSGLGRLYLNGILVAQQNLGVFTPQTGYNLYLGNRPGSALWSGLLDEISLYNRALSSNEVASIYDAGTSGKCPLIAPAIISQPTNQTVTAGGTASFSVTANGTPPLSYQWNLNTTSIVGATSTTLTLTNVQVSQAGNYTVLVTNLFGSVLSSNAILVVTLDHFAWNPIPSPRFVNTPFAVVIQARDMTNGLFTNFTGTAILDSTNGVAVTPPVSGNFVQGVWTGAVVVSQTASNLVLRADDGFGHFGLANPINVVSLPCLGILCSGNIALYMWPVGYPGFVLETSGNLSPAAWVVVPYSPIQIGDQYLLPLDMTGTNGFYRLRFPDP
jgi:hypothetical protein